MRKTARQFRPRPAATLVTLLMLSVLWSLALWQVQRLTWKTALVADMTAKQQAAPVPLPAAIDNPQDWAFRRVTLSGRFLPQPVFFLQPRTHRGMNGYHAVTPFRRDDGTVVFVNRGWVPSRDDAAAVPPRGRTTVSGVAQLPVKGYFMAENDPARDAWYWADIPAMAQAAGQAAVPPVLVVVPPSESDSLPAGIALSVAVRNQHAQYAAFWFAMGFVLLAVYVASHRREET